MSVQKAESRYAPNGLPGQNTCLNGGSIISLNFFILCLLQAARFHTRRKQSSVPTEDLRWPGLEAAQAGKAERLGGQQRVVCQSPVVLGALGFCSSLKVPGSASKPTELRSGVLHAASKLHTWSFEFLRALPIFFQPISWSYWISLLLAVFHATPAALWEMAGAGLSEVQQDVFSFAVERRSFISVKAFSPRVDKE